MPRKFAVKPAASRRAVRDASPGFSRGWKGVLALGALALVFGGGMLAQINGSASHGYEIRSLEKKIADLKDEQEKLEYDVASEQSIQAVERHVADYGLVPAERVEYVTAAAVAAR